LEARLAHPIYEPLRQWLSPGLPGLEALDAAALGAGLRTESGAALRFAAPVADDENYELRAHRSGRVSSRPGNLHDVFNALAWLAFPRTKARLNALHAAQIPLEGGRRGRFRDLLTIFDEGGAVVVCDDEELIALLRGFRWRELFWERRERVLASMRILVLGHAVLEQALEPWPGITCKAMFVTRAGSGGDPDSQAAAWLGGLGKDATPRVLAPLPIFGYPAWFPGNEREEFYEDERYFRPFRRDKITPGVGQAAAARNSARAEESPGSEERDAG
jgi:hypothetical protein